MRPIFFEQVVTTVTTTRSPSPCDYDTKEARLQPREVDRVAPAQVWIDVLDPCCAQEASTQTCKQRRIDGRALPRLSAARSVSS